MLRKATVMLCAATISVALAQEAWAVERFKFVMSSQSVADAVKSLSYQTEHSVLFRTDHLGDIQTKAISGEYSLEEALNALLMGTNLEGVLTESGVIVITQKIGVKAPFREDQEVVVDKKFRRSLLASVSALFIGSLSANALGQENSGDPSLEYEPDEIIVTATKRDTSLQDTAMALSVITGADLEKRQAITINDFVGSIPGVTVSVNSPSTTVIKIRGVTTSSFADDVPTTATYLDDFPMGLNAVPIRLIDMERVEILKGPQGTLYGQSSMGGAVRYITKKPNTDKIEGGVSTYASQVKYGGTSYGAQAYLNVPLADTLAVRGILYKRDDAGWIDLKGVFLGDFEGGRFNQNVNDANSSSVLGGRIALRWQAADNVSFDLMYMNENVKGTIPYLSATYSAEPGDTEGTDVMPINYSDPSSRYFYRQDVHHKILSLKSTVEFDAFDLNLMVGHRDRIEGGREGIFADEITFLGLAYGGAPHQGAVVEATNTLELRAASNYEDGDLLSWIGGVWYEDQKASGFRYLKLFTGDDNVLAFGAYPNNGILFDFTYDRSSSELAFYGDVGIHFNENAVLSLGYRRANVGYGLDILTGNGLLDGARRRRIGKDESVSQNVNTYKANFEYTLNDDVLLYALATSGYRRGGFAQGSLDGKIPDSEFESDSLWNYEIGTRTSWFDNRLTLNVNAYRIDWSNMQLRTRVSSSDGTSFQTQTANIGAARILGVEGESILNITENLTLGANFALVDAKATEAVPLEGVLVGDRLPGSAKYSYGLTADWNSSLSSTLDLTVHVDHQYTGNRLGVLGSADSFLGAGVIKSGNLTNMSVALVHEDGINVSVFARNVFNHALLGAEVNTIPQITNSSMLVPPRTIGVNLSYDF